MAILDVREDYGAVGDGSTDDSGAIQRAIEDTDPGDTVFIPETSDAYRVVSGGRAAVALDGAADGVTIEGGGPDAVLRLDRTDRSPFAMGTDSLEDADWNTLTVRRLRFDGDNQRNGDGHAFGWGSDARVTGLDILMEDCIFERAPRSGLSFYGDGVSRITVRNCTARRNTSHGFNPIGTGEGSPGDPEVVFERCVAVDNDSQSFDFHLGNHLAREVYTENNRTGMKAGSAHGYVEHVTLRDVNITDSRGHGWRATISDENHRYTADLDNVQVVDADGEGFRIEHDARYTVGTILADGCGDGDNDHGVYVDDTAAFTADTVVSQNSAEHGIMHAAPTTSSVGTYRHAGNGGNPVNEFKGSVDVGEAIAGESARLDVPGPGDVGAFAGDWSSGDGSSGDGSSGEDTSGSDPSSGSAPLFEDWTPRWASARSDWSVRTTDSNVEDAVLELDAASPGRHSLSCDAVGTATDVDVLALVRVPSDVDDASSWCRLVGRGSGSAGEETGYFVAFHDNPSFDIVKYDGGSSTTLAATDVEAVPGTWLYVRFNVSGEQLRARYWRHDRSEPTDWTLTATDGDITGPGWVGAGGWSTDRQQWDAFSVATGGDTAALVGSDSPPTVTWERPADGASVSDTVTLSTAASDPEDDDDALTVEYRVDDGAWSVASYDAGRYVAQWDSTAVSDGQHTLAARVTDSAGGTSTATTTVTTDNSTAGPAVDDLSVTEEETSDADAEFDVDWRVSDPDGDLDAVDLALVGDGTTRDEATATVDGDSAARTTRLVAPDGDGSGADYTVEVAVTDGEGTTTTRTAPATETEDGGAAPSIDRFSVSEAGRDDPDAEITVVWDASDADGDLESVDIAVADAGETVAGVTWTVAGTAASDTDAFTVRNGDGRNFDVSIEVTDATGQSSTLRASVTA